MLSYINRRSAVPAAVGLLANSTEAATIHWRFVTLSSPHSSLSFTSSESSIRANMSRSAEYSSLNVAFSLITFTAASTPLLCISLQQPGFSLVASPASTIFGFPFGFIALFLGKNTLFKLRISNPTASNGNYYKSLRVVSFIINLNALCFSAFRFKLFDYYKNRDFFQLSFIF